ncbi:hypothetical protein EPA93_22620 [Ktedonosporobacter rubrisoli]|uniref:NYN domain-containing protein n=1 Tax=Ktedonosporobacter rubrisoli TaxID=2509675 RepID=A0A4P6JTN0_KTERU|nr:NYN domain-containing protein [Ktedonosporobacter rubrisoli]QBD78632.1 hypothetical protein EPA93_22620 [Ktedonosporobacter rubrisoli]
MGLDDLSYDILVDGYNVIKNNLMFRTLETRSQANARDLLIKQLKNRFRHTLHRVIVVFDGNGTREQVSHDDHIRIIFSRHGETADNVIVRLAAQARQAGRKVVMYSDDDEVQCKVSEQGGNVHTTGQLTRKLHAPPRDVEIRSQHRQTMRRIYGLDPAYKYEDDLEPVYYPNGKKLKRRKSHRH